jgi:ankyrin repeat protein
MQANLCPVIAKGDLQSVREYLNQGGDIDANVEILPSEKYDVPTDSYETGRLPAETGSLLRCALLRHRTDIALYLSQQGADITDLIANSVRQPKYANRAVTNDETVKFLLAAKVDLNRSGMDGKTLLYTAAKFKNYHLVNQLIDRGAKTSTDYTYSENLLHLLMYSYPSYYSNSTDIDNDEFAKLVRYLTDRMTGEDGISKGEFLNTIIGRTSNENLLEKLLQIYSVRELNTSGLEGNRLLHVAIGSNYEVAKKLIARGVDVNIRNDRGETPLTIASKLTDNKSKLKVKLLLASGANVNVRTKGGETPLTLAVKANNDELESIVKLLLDYGANVNARDRNGKNAIAINSATNKNYKIYRLLRSYQ